MIGDAKLIADHVCMRGFYDNKPPDCWAVFILRTGLPTHEGARVLRLFE